MVEQNSRPMLSKKLLLLWIGWIVLSSCSYFLAGQAAHHHTRTYQGDLLHSLLHLPQHDNKQPAMPEPLHKEQQLMLEALQRQKQQELQLLAQQKRGRNSTSSEDVLRLQQEKWPDGYIAVCAVVKDQGRDLRYWIEYHRWLGVSKFYIYDNNSTLPAMMVLWDYLREGLVDYQYFRGKPRKKPDFMETNQYKAYHGCLLQHFRQHRWLAFIDVDEFLVFNNDNSSSGSRSGPAAADTSSNAADSNAQQQRHLQQQQQSQQLQLWDSQSRRSLRDPKGVAVPAPPDDAPASSTGSSSSSSSNSGSSSSGSDSAHSLPLFLHDFERHAALGVNWVLFGSSGLQERPRQGPLGAFSSCVPQEHWESTHVKVIANTGGILGIGPTPHEMLMRPSMTTVDVDGQPFKGPKTPRAKWHKLVLHHYVLKSKAEFATKSARGSGAGNVKTWGYWDYIEGLSNQTCTQGLAVSRAFLASNPRLKQSKQGHFCSKVTQQAATQQLQAAAADVLVREEHGAPSQWNRDGVVAADAAAGAGAAALNSSAIGAAAGGAAGAAAGARSVVAVDDDDAYDWV